MKLYKYVTPNRVDVLKHREIRFTPAAELNDLLEFQPLISSAQLIDFLNHHSKGSFDADIVRLVETALAERGISLADTNPLGVSVEDLLAIVKSEVMEQYVIPSFRRQVLERARSEIGVLSLSEDPYSPPMWAHYTANHSGFVIGFDASHSFFHQQRSPNDEFNHIRKVKYARRVPIRLFFLDGTDFFATKDESWSYEKEWRMLIDLRTCPNVINGCIHLFPLPPSAISEILIGPKMQQSDRQNLCSALSASDYRHVQVFQVIHDPSGPMVYSATSVHR